MTFADLLPSALEAARPRVTGRVARVLGLNLEVAGIDAAIGDAVIVDAPGQPDDVLLAEVVALRDDGAVCMPFGDLRGVRAGAPVEATGRPPTIKVGDGLLGRVVDGLGRPLDGGPPLANVIEVTVEGTPPHPLRRARVERQLGLGVRALDTLVPCGAGQRLGIFAGSGVGKSSLLSMIARGTSADVSVLALVGERGREVREFIEGDLGDEGLARSVVVVSTSDEPALVRLRAAFTATRISEWFRDEGRDVVLMMDSLTRFAMAQREVGLSAGEPPATRGYPPSVFSLLPRLLERAGQAERGSITGLYTVLVEGDDMNEPIADAARSILDGHVVLSRRLATAAHFPSIDVLESISRVSGAVTGPDQQRAATELRMLLAAYRDAKDLIEIGAYVPGTNPTVDRAVALKDAADGFLKQGMHEPAPHDVSWALLQHLVGDLVKKYRFRLETVLRVRRIEEERAMGELLAANRALAEADAVLEQRLDHYRTVSSPAGTLTHDRYVALRSRQDSAAAAVVSAGAARIMAEAEAEAKRLLWAAAATKVRALERLDEHRREEHAVEALHEETIFLDELATSRLGAGG